MLFPAAAKRQEDIFTKSFTCGDSLLFVSFEEENGILPGSNMKCVLSTMSFFWFTWPGGGGEGDFSNIPFIHFSPTEMI